VAASNCRGADSLAEFIRQRDKIVQAMKAIDADVFGLMEIQNDGDPTKVDTAVQTLVDALNASIGTNPYAIVPTPPTTGTDAIRVAMIYKPAALTLAGASMSDGSAIHNRPPFAQTFQNTAGEKFSVVVNHMKSKSCTSAAGADLDLGDGQGCYNDRRKQQATALLAFIETIKTTSGDPDVLVIGDLNAYGKEDPIDILTTGGLVDQVSRFNTNDYSYVFDGELGYIDHALATPSLSTQTPGTTHWHINADEPSIIDYNLEFKQPACATCGPDYFTPTPYRASDHDPVIVAINLGPVQQAQTITFVQPTAQVTHSAFTLTATASSGLAVSFSSLTPAVCTVSGTLASMLTAGTCAIAADQAGNASFLPAPQVQRSFTVALSAQSITFPLPADRGLDAGAFNAGATATSGLAVTVTSQTAGVCTVVDQTVSLMAAGTCTLVANQPGNEAYAAATAVTVSFTVQPASVVAGDVPLPPWALGLLGTGMIVALGRRVGALSRA
jgi:endonuclease/exonuclease/phosphatase family metal-dependent hydrolase